MSIDKASFDLFSKKVPEVKPTETIRPEPVQTYAKTPVEIKTSIVEERQAEIKTSTIPQEKPVQIKTRPASKKVTTKLNKYETFLPATVRLKQEDFMDLKHIENSIMRSRTKGDSEERERITTNSIIRCLVSSFIDRADLFDFEEIDNEEILNQRIQKVFRGIPNTQNQ